MGTLCIAFLKFFDGLYPIVFDGDSFELRNLYFNSIWRISFFKKRQNRKIRNIGKNNKSKLLIFRCIFLMVWFVFLWFPMVRWCGICVIEQNGKSHVRCHAQCWHSSCRTCYLGVSVRDMSTARFLTG